MAIRILVVDDHRILRAGLKTLLSSAANLEVVGEATNGEEAIQVAGILKPDIVLMDIGMPGMDALGVTRILIQNQPGVKVLILTMHEDSTLLQEYLNAGASGYIIKRAAESELVDAIYAVWRGMIYVHPSLMQTLFTQNSLPVQPPTRLESKTLTAREIDVLNYIVKGYTNGQIASTLNLSIRTVESHRANLMDKLNLRSRVDLVRYANENKLLRPDSD